jgi:hypothetical protein
MTIDVLSQTWIGVRLCGPHGLGEVSVVRNALNTSLEIYHVLHGKRSVLVAVHFKTMLGGSILIANTCTRLQCNNKALLSEARECSHYH